MQTRRTLRASFVITVAATVGALNAGCADTVNGETPDGSSVACPTYAPQGGSACDPALGSRVCSYGCSFGGDGTATCVGGRWESRIGTCNPPAPDVMPIYDTNPPPPMCPATVPMAGSPCVVSMVPTMCNYGDCGGSPTTFAQCLTGTWQIGVVSCNPPLDAPPPQDVTDASVDANSDGSLCPAADPSNGALCPMPGLSCQYGDCTSAGGRVAYATCDDTGHWRHAAIVCNPPLVSDGGPDA